MGNFAENLNLGKRVCPWHLGDRNFKNILTFPITKGVPERGCATPPQGLEKIEISKHKLHNFVHNLG